MLSNCSIHTHIHTHTLTDCSICSSPAANLLGTIVTKTKKKACWNQYFGDRSTKFNKNVETGLVWHQNCAQTSEQVSERTKIRGQVPEIGCYLITQISRAQERRAVMKLPLILDQLLPSLIAAVAVLLVTCYISCRLSQKWLFLDVGMAAHEPEPSWQNNDRKP